MKPVVTGGECLLLEQQEDEHPLAPPRIHQRFILGSLYKSTKR
jgi:hypothetical protein